MMTPGEEAEMRAILADRYAEGYKAGRIAALREVGCHVWVGGGECKTRGFYGIPFPRDRYCPRCRLLAEAESGEQEAERCDYCGEPDAEFDVWSRDGLVIKRKCRTRCDARPFIELTHRRLAQEQREVGGEG